MALRNERLYVDMPLTDLAIDFSQDWAGEALQDRLFPVKQTKYETGTFVVFDAVRRFRTYRDLRADGAEANAISVKYGKDTFSQEEFALRGPVTDRERDQSIDPISPEQDIVELVSEALLLRREERARDAIFPTSYSHQQTCSPLWTASNPTVIKDMHTAKKAFHKKTGKMPSLLIISPVLWDMFFDDSVTAGPGATLVSRLQYTMAVKGNEITPALVAQLLDVPEIVVPKTLVANPALNATIADASVSQALTGSAYIWDVDAGGTQVTDIVLVYVNGAGGRRALTVGWCFSSQPLTVFRYREDAKRTEWFELSRVEQIKVVSTACIFRIKVA